MKASTDLLPNLSRLLAPRGSIIEYQSASDSSGYSNFSLHWVDQFGQRRTQFFFGDPHKYGHKRPEELKGDGSANP